MLCAALGLSMAATACGDSGDTKEEGVKAGDDSKNDAGGGITIGDNNGGANGATNNTAGDGGTGGCTGPGQQCMCSDGQMGFQACTSGVLGECTCSIDLGDAGLPPVSDCLTDATCQSTMGFIKGVPGFCAPASDGGGAGPGGASFPPMCATKIDCETAGLPTAPCVTIMIPVLGAQQLCVQPCLPEPAPAPAP